MNTLKFTLPYPPSVNTYWRHAVTKGMLKRSITYISERGRQYRTEVACLLGGLVAKPISEAMYVSCDLILPDRRRRDIDNVLKALLDAMEHAGVYADDSLITHLIVSKFAINKPGRVNVTILSPWGEPHVVTDAEVERFSKPFAEIKMGGEEDETP